MSCLYDSRRNHYRRIRAYFIVHKHLGYTYQIMFCYFLITTLFFREKVPTEYKYCVILVLIRPILHTQNKNIEIARNYIKTATDESFKIVSCNIIYAVVHEKFYFLRKLYFTRINITRFSSTRWTKPDPPTLLPNNMWWFPPKNLINKNPRAWSRSGNRNLPNGLNKPLKQYIF